MCHPLQEGLRSRLYLELILDDSGSLVIIVTDEVDIIDPRWQFGVEADQQIHSFSWSEVHETNVLHRFVEESSVGADD